MDHNKKSKPRLLGEYFPCSRGSIRMAMQKKRDAKVKHGHKKLLGELLVESGTLTQEELSNGLRRQRADRISMCEVFESLTATELLGICQHFSEVTFEAEKQFIFEGETDPTLYILVDGKLEVFSKNDNGDEIHIAHVGVGEPIGEMGYFQDGIRAASVRAVTPVELLSAPYIKLTHYFENVPHVAMAFTQVVKRRQAELNKKLGKEEEL